jgi:hypothetical protein
MTLPTGSFRASDVRTRAPQGIVGGRVYSDPLDRIDTLVNKDPQAYQVDSITVDTAADSTAYTVSVAGQTIIYTSGVGASKITIAAGIAAAILANAIAAGRVNAASDGVDTVTVTGRLPGDSYTVSDSDANITTASVTSAATAEDVYFGRVMISSGFASTEGYRYGRMAKSTAFSAQVATLDYTYDADEILYVQVFDKATGDLIAGASHVMATAKTNSTTAIVGILNAQAPANSVLFANSGDTILCTAELAGLEFEVKFWTDDATTAATLTNTATTGPSISTSLLRAISGISLYTMDEEATAQDGTTAVYPANAGVKVLEKGSVWVENSQTLVYGTPVYVELDGTGDDYGKCFNTNSATRLALPRSVARWERSGVESADSLGALILDVHAAK